jgi:hypothetical protein
VIFFAFRKWKREFKTGGKVRAWSSAENWILIKLYHKHDFARKKSDLNNSKIL